MLPTRPLPLQALSWILAACLLSASGAQARDNFLVVTLDDIGVDGIGIYSDDVQYGHPGEGASPGPTPHIDDLARDGLLFRNAYTNPVCSPTRAATLTGRHGFRTGIGTPVGSVLPTSETLLPEVLVNHLNAAIGKWHLGGTDADHPNDSGFTYFAGGLGGGVGNYFNWNRTEQGSTNTEMNYSTSVNVDDALAQITAFGANEWFVWLAFNAPHTPFHAPPPTLHTQSLSGDPNDTPEVHYEAAVEALDNELQELLDALPQDVLDDTTIIVMGDNGTPRQAVEPPFIDTRAKGSVYEGGINVPFIVKSPHIPVSERGKEVLAPVQSVDIFATLAEIAAVPADTAVDSISFLPLLQDPAAAGDRTIVYTESFAPNGFGPYTTEQRAAIWNGYKLIWRDGVYEELFHLPSDAFEGTNLLGATLDVNAEHAYGVLTAHMETLHAPVVPALPGGSLAALWVSPLFGALAAVRLRTNR